MTIWCILLVYVGKLVYINDSMRSVSLLDDFSDPVSLLVIRLYSFQVLLTQLAGFMSGSSVPNCFHVC